LAHRAYGLAWSDSGWAGGGGEVGLTPQTKMKKKSPIKDKPLRYVGQSLDEKINQLISEDAIPYVVVSIMMLYLAGYEWYRYFKSPPPSPKMMSIIALSFVIFSFYKVRKINKKVKAMKLGRVGERVVGQYLENLREKGHRIFHDLLAENFNLDHYGGPQKLDNMLSYRSLTIQGDDR